MIRRKKSVVNNKTTSVSNVDEGKTRNTYKTNDLVCARLLMVSPFMEDPLEAGPTCQETDLYYFFKKEETLENGKYKIKYEEVFTKYKFSDQEEYLGIPYLIDIQPYLQFFPEEDGKEIPITMLLLKLDTINPGKTKKYTKVKQ